VVYHWCDMDDARQVNLVEIRQVARITSACMATSREWEKDCHDCEDCDCGCETSMASKPRGMPSGQPKLGDEQQARAQDSGLRSMARDTLLEGGSNDKDSG